MLLKDLPSDSLDIDWSIHMPLMLHIALLGMDHSRPLVHQHCKQLLLNLLLVLANNSDQLTIAQVLLNRDTMRLGLGLPTPPVPVSQHNFTGTYRQLTSRQKPILYFFFIFLLNLYFIRCHNENSSSSLYWLYGYAFGLGDLCWRQQKKLLLN